MENNTYALRTQQSMFKALETSMNGFFEILSETYNIPKKEILALWSGGASPKTSVKDVFDDNRPADTPDDGEELEYDKMSKSDLVAKCKEHGLKVSGSKPELITRLKEKLSVATEGVVSTTASVAKPKMDTSKPPILVKLASAAPTFLIKRNSFGNYEHTGTHIVFENVTKKAIGTQGSDGAIIPLTEEDIEQCHKYNFAYVLPKNLDANVGTSKEEDKDAEEEEEYEEIEAEVELEEENEDEEEYEEVVEEVEEYEEEV